MEVEIRKATLRDLPEVRRMSRMLFRKEASDYDMKLNRDWPVQKGGERYLRGMVSRRDKCTLLAVSGGRIVGYLAGGLTDRKMQECYLVRIAEINDMFVLKEFRGREIGKRLAEEFRSWCRERGAARIFVCAFSGNARAMSFYRRDGFRDYSVRLMRKL